jgi:proteasome lid subunit RPN8/RPN11
VKNELHLRDGLFEDLRAHLLPPGNRLEQAAFLFATSVREASATRFDVVAVEKLISADFDVQTSAYLELSDATRKRLIKRAHDLGTSLIEMHSHPGPWPAAFSESDRIGLRETVPHMWWRLAKRPYIAIVVARSGIDALAWLDCPTTPGPLNAVFAGTRLVKPTNLSLPNWI